MVLGKLAFHMQKVKLHPYLLPYTKNQVKVDRRPKYWTRNPNPTRYCRKSFWTLGRESEDIPPELRSQKPKMNRATLK
jgi:hypothetical protein